jgi:hypothetical protein
LKSVLRLRFLVKRWRAKIWDRTYTAKRAKERAMAGLEAWEIGLFATAAFVAVSVLIRLMARRRDKLLDDLSRDVADHRRKSKPPV